VGFEVGNAPSISQLTRQVWVHSACSVRSAGQPVRVSACVGALTVRGVHSADSYLLPVHLPGLVARGLTAGRRRRQAMGVVPDVESRGAPAMDAQKPGAFETAPAYPPMAQVPHGPPGDRRPEPSVAPRRCLLGRDDARLPLLPCWQPCLQRRRS